MYVSPTRLPHLLAPDAYHSDEQFHRECAAMRRDAWHFVATTDDLRRPGDFVTCELLGHPVQVRNFGGELRAMSNVCAHRHCLISGQRQGNSPTMRCQYHGWEYGADGGTRHIPSPRNFAPYQGRQCLPVYRVATCGHLVFVALGDEAGELREFLGDFYDVIAERFGYRFEPSLTWDQTLEANWKVVIENSLEAYHVPCVHPRTFGCDPGELRSFHLLCPSRTALRTQLPFSPHSRLDRWFQRREANFLRWLGEEVTGDYWQHHVFPNLLFSFTDALSLCHVVVPTGPTTCRSVVRQFGIGRHAGFPARWLCRAWGRMTAYLARRIMREDIPIFSQIQQGLQHSQQPGVLGRCEERIHAFQQYVQDTLAAGETTQPGATAA